MGPTSVLDRRFPTTEGDRQELPGPDRVPVDPIPTTPGVRSDLLRPRLTRPDDTLRVSSHTTPQGPSLVNTGPTPSPTDKQQRSGPGVGPVCVEPPERVVDGLEGRVGHHWPVDLSILHRDSRRPAEEGLRSPLQVGSLVSQRPPGNPTSYPLRNRVRSRVGGGGDGVETFAFGSGLSDGLGTSSRVPRSWRV